MSFKAISRRDDWLLYWWYQQNSTEFTDGFCFSDQEALYNSSLHWTSEVETLPNMVHSVVSYVMFDRLFGFLEYDAPPEYEVVHICTT